MSVVESVALGIIQGLTEFLPVSSSGHLAAAQIWMKFEHSPILFDIFLHIATVLVAGVYFRHAIYKTIRGAIQPSRETGPNFLSDRRRGVFIILAMTATALVGFPLQHVFESFFANGPAVGAGLLMTASVLVVAQTWRRSLLSGSVPVWHALVVGCVQGAALMPGLSRSGATIGVALLLGWPREEAFRFSFLLAIPAVLGAAFVKLIQLDGVSMSWAWVPGLLAALISGWIGLIWLRRALLRDQLIPFALWCMVVAAVLLFGGIVR